MRLLVVTHSFTPAISPRSIRWQRVVEWLMSRGHEVHVICGRVPGSAALEVANGLVIHRVGGGWVESIRKRVRSSSSVGSGAGTADHGRFRAQSAVKWMHDRIWKPLYWPDYACLWYPAAVRSATDLARLKDIDAMVSVSPPFTAHLVARRLRTRFPGLPWLVDIGDPFSLLDHSEVNNAALFARMNSWIERRIVHECDVISVTTPQTAGMYVEGFGLVPEKVIVTPPIAKLPSPKGARELEDRRADGRIRAAYAGTFYKHIREPDAMIDVLEAALAADGELRDRFSFDVYGDVDQFRSRFARAPRLSGAAVFHGSVDPSALMDHLANADVLVNLGNLTDYQLPSKIVEYIGLRRPILNVCQIAGDSSAKLLVNHPAALNVNVFELPAAALRVAGFLRSAITTQVPHTLVAELTRPYLISNVCSQYESVLESMVSTSRKSKDG